MNYYVDCIKKVHDKISKLSKEELRDVDALVSQLFHDFKKEPIVLKYSNDFKLSQVEYDYVPIGLSCSISSQGKVNAYTFAYQIVASQDFIADLLKYIKILNPSYDERVDFYIEEDQIKYIHLNYCKIIEKQTLDINQTIFDLLMASIEAIQTLMNNYAEFQTIVSKYIKARLLELE